MDKIILYFVIKYKGNWDKVYDALENLEKVDPLVAENLEKEVKKHVNYITILNPKYPNNLRISYRPPFVLFYHGNIKLLLAYWKTVGVITNPKEVSDLAPCEDNIIKNGFIMLGEDNYRHHCEGNHIYFSTTPIKDKYPAKDYEHGENLFVSEFYDHCSYDQESDRGFLLRPFSGLTNNNLIYANQYELAFDQVIAYMQNNGNNIFGLATSEQNTVAKLTRRGVVMVDNIATMMETI